MTVFISFDVETTGSNPVHHNLLSLAAVADVAVSDDLTDLQRIPNGEFSLNIQERPTYGWDPDTRKWWHSAKNHDALEMTLQEPRMEPGWVMGSFMDWLDLMVDKAEDMMTPAGLKSWDKHQHAAGNVSPIVFVAYPIVFDMSWLRHYMFTYEPQRFTRLGWASFSGVDIMTMMMMLRQTVPYLTGGENWDPEWGKVMEPFHNPKHVALHDARAQAALFKHLLRANTEIFNGYLHTLVRHAG